MSRTPPADDPSDARRALVLHDRPIVVDLIELTLNHGLFVVRSVTTAAEATTIIADWRPHMAVVDMDHDDSGAMLQLLGASNTMTRSSTPILGLARRGDLPTKLRAFELGVDDILAMPFSPDELLARAIVISRRSSGIDRPIVPTIRLGEMDIDIVNRQVTAGSSVVHLSGIEQSLLYLLASRNGRVVTREEILDGVWGTDFVAERNIVDRHIRSLRIKLQDDYRHPRFIATVPGRGYRFIPTFTNAGWGGESAVRALPSLDVGAARDAALADRIRSGDRMALGELYDRYAPLALAAALRSSPDRTRAEAAVHDAFVAVWKGIDRFDHGADDLSTWVMGFVRRHGAQ